jgi:hypothetical protein
MLKNVIFVATLQVVFLGIINNSANKLHGFILHLTDFWVRFDEES